MHLVVTQQVATWQDTASAVGTLLAVAVALAVALVEIVRSARSSKRLRETQRLSTAGLVSAWVDEQYLPNAAGSAYIRHARACVANEANEPVYNVAVTIGVGYKTRSIGPLAVPVPIPVLPARKTLAWDISLPLRAHDDTDSPCAEIAFTDSSNRRWLRRFDGSLIETTSSPGQLVMDEDFAEAQRQVGRLDDPGNPMVVAMAFLSLFSEDELDMEKLQTVIAPEAPGWHNLAQEDMAWVMEELSDYGLGGYVSYPAPHVAYVKILPPSATALRVEGSGPVEITGAKIITLTYLPERGWRVFSYGPPTEADRILFPEGSLFFD
jgi:hypothetical protein